MNQYCDQAGPMRPGEELDQGKLEDYLRSQWDDFQPPLEIRQFPSGHSNLTYLLKSPSHEVVLRRPPFGNKVKKAHDMSREHLVLSRLAPALPSVPAPLLLEEDEEVIGSSFYIMPRLEGIILRRELPEGLEFSPDEARTLSRNFIDQLAQLHQLDYTALGLADWGRPQGYIQRQVEGWTRRYNKAKTDEIPEVEEIARWLDENQPSSTKAAVIHNDYKYDNLILNPVSPTEITAILDWEMSTLGHPWMDLGTALAYWVNPDDPPSRREMRTCVTHLPGTMTRRELVDRYQEQTGENVEDLLFYYAFALFKIAVVAQQIYTRFAQGATKDKRFAQMIHFVRRFSQTALEVVASEEI